MLIYAYHTLEHQNVIIALSWDHPVEINLLVNKVSSMRLLPYSEQDFDEQYEEYCSRYEEDIEQYEE